MFRKDVFISKNKHLFPAEIFKHNLKMSQVFVLKKDLIILEDKYLFPTKIVKYSLEMFQVLVFKKDLFISILLFFLIGLHPHFEGAVS